MVNLESALVKTLNESTHPRKSKLYLSQFTDNERRSVGMTPDMYTIFKHFIGEGNGVAHPGSISLRECNEVMAGLNFMSMRPRVANLGGAITKLIALLTKNKVVHKSWSLEL